MNCRALLVFLMAVSASAALAKPNKAKVEQSDSGGHDGIWSFETTTVSGSCPGLAPSNVTIQGGSVISANSGSVSPWGYVEGDGTFVARFTDQSGHVSRASGTLQGVSGSGAWSSSTDLCGGAWRATRTSSRAAQ